MLNIINYPSLNKPLFGSFTALEMEITQEITQQQKKNGKYTNLELGTKKVVFYYITVSP